MEILDLTSYKKAIESLNEVIEKYNSNIADLIVRDSMIQRFEYTYSISLKMLKRYFKMSAFAQDDVENMTFNQMIRQANKMGLLMSNLEVWDNYRQKRNLTSHTYDEEIAKQVVCIINDFAQEAKFLYCQLKEKSNVRS